jgi:uncharacterized repeat protein (TIGR03803 family)
MPGGGLRRAWFVAALALALAAACSPGGEGSPTGATGPCAGIAESEQLAEGIEVVHAFAGDDGAEPLGSLLAWRDRLYGRTSAGGPGGAGVLFSLAPDGSDLDVLRAFEPGPDAVGGNGPRFDFPGMYSSYVTNNVAGGGAGDHGVTFFVDPATGAERPMHAYGGAPGDGSQPSSGIETTPEGMWILTPRGGAHDRGALVRMDPETGATEVAHSFSGPDGAEPFGRVTRSGPRTLYGMTTSGGSADAGVVFAYDPVAIDLRVLHEFGPGPANGERPHHGKLVGGPGNAPVWGLTEAGGAHGRGVLFSVAPDGSAFQVHHSFGAEPTDAAGPRGSLTRVGEQLYGLSSEGGRWGLGSVFRIGDDGRGYEVVASFGGSEAGAFPHDSLTAVQQEDGGSSLYGMASSGGSNDPGCQLRLGTVFRLDVAPAAG